MTNTNIMLKITFLHPHCIIRNKHSFIAIDCIREYNFFFLLQTMIAVVDLTPNSQIERFTSIFQANSRRKTMLFRSTIAFIPFFISSSLFYSELLFVLFFSVILYIFFSFFCFLILFQALLTLPLFLN